MKVSKAHSIVPEIAHLINSEAADVSVTDFGTHRYQTPFQISEPKGIRLRFRFRNPQVSDSVPDLGTHRYQTPFQISEPGIRLRSRFRNQQVSDSVPDFGTHRYLLDSVPDFGTHRYQTLFQISEPTGIYQILFQISKSTGIRLRCRFRSAQVPNSADDFLTHSYCIAPA